jgi:hypothetical protein
MSEPNESQSNASQPSPNQPPLQPLKRRGMRGRIFLIAPLALLGIALFCFIGGQIVLHLWNWILPDLFGFREVTFWQALGLLALCRILFGGFGFHGSTRSRFRRRMEERCESMTPEERARFREAMRSKLGFSPSGE